MDSTVALAQDAFRQLGLESTSAGGTNEQVDLVLDPWSAEVPLRLKRFALVDESTARRLVSDISGVRDKTREEAQLVVVADRVTSDAREVLMHGSVGYIDLRGHLGIRNERLIISSSFESLTAPERRANALSGPATLEVAAAVLMRSPDEPTSVRDLARAIDRSPSTVSDTLSHMRRERLVDGSNKPHETDLFWALAEQWGRTRRLPLEELPRPGEASVVTKQLALGLEDVSFTPGWALTDTAAAAVYGAPLASHSAQVLDFLVPNGTVLRRAENLLGVATSRERSRCTVRVAPIRAACEQRVDLDDNYYEWPLAHPLFVALDLAQDKGRGREVLDSWTPLGEWQRVW